MKKTILITGLLVCLLASGLIFVSCGGGGDTKDDTVPHLSEICLVADNTISPEWNPKTTLAISDAIQIGIKGTDSDKDIVKFVYTVRKDTGSTGYPEERAVSIMSSPFTFWVKIGSWSRGKGNYTLEIYAVDAKKQQSNTMSINFTIN